MNKTATRQNSWREVKLSEVTEPIKKTYLPSSLEVLSYIGLEHIQKETLRLNGIGKSTDVSSNKFVFDKNDVLFGKLRPYFRKVYKPNFSGICSTDIWVFKAKEGVLQDFLFYFLANWDFVNTASGGEGGTRMPRADWNFLKLTVWPIPPLQEQKAIAEVLSSLDEKIDLLHRQNKTLEDMAQALFRKCFTEETKAYSVEKPLSYFGEIICGKTPSKKIHEYFGGKIPFIKIPDMHGNTFIFDTLDTLTKKGEISQSNKTLPSRSICVSCIATVGLVSMNAIESQTNQQINSIIPKKGEYRYFLYLFMKASKDLLYAMASGGTATLNLNTSNFSKIPILYSEESEIYKFHEKVKPFFEKIFFNQSQIHILENLRDNLLPKLMSAKVRMKS